MSGRLRECRIDCRQLLAERIVAGSAKFAQRPEAQPGFAHDFFTGDCPAEMRIGTVVAVVSQYEIGIRRQGLGGHHVGRGGFDVGFFEGHSVKIDQVVFYFDGITWQADQPFDILACGFGGRVENDDIAALGGVKSFYNDQPLALDQGGLHADIENLAALNYRAQQKKDEHCQSNGDQQLFEISLHRFESPLVCMNKLYSKAGLLARKCA